eukprot:TRINITY_DN19564_c0_g1_i1.p1 TRINITY_DN19564_c0_g1~~TRINITY_DN19564_c0_g1_i1.p1  ORF type:complete len:349 (+),score=55.85 TRINITY_DN19564_c0_g1_i1:53-1048(+)
MGVGRRLLMNIPMWSVPVWGSGILYLIVQSNRYLQGVSVYGQIHTNKQLRRPIGIYKAGAYEISQLCNVVPYGVLGTALTQDKQIEKREEQPDGMQVIIVDPAGLHHIHGLPKGAAGAAGAIYAWIGEEHLPMDQPFPSDVSEGIQHATHAARHVYGTRPVIHAVGPDLRTEKYQGEEGYFAAKRDLSLTYTNILKEFAEYLKPDLMSWNPDEENQNVRQPWGTLRVLPVSGGIFSGRFKKDMPELTAGALVSAIQALPPTHRRALACRAQSIDLCVFDDREFKGFKQELYRVSENVRVSTPLYADTFSDSGASMQNPGAYKVHEYKSKDI